MGASVARLHGSSANGDGGIPPADIYRTAVEEYRFQAQHNWSRTQYLLGLNVAILAAAVALSIHPGHGSALVFAFGIVAAGVSSLAIRTQHGYYRAARKHLRRVEERFGVAPGQQLDTTSTMGKRQRKVSVNQAVYLLLTSLATADAVGAVFIVVR